MKRQELFKVWSAPESPWSPWAKAVLFSTMPEIENPVGLGDLKTVLSSPWNPTREAGTALILDMDGLQSVYVAVLCARQGYRPVPLFNACDGPFPILEQASLIQSLFQATADLSSLNLPPQAPPVFMLDARRMMGTPSPTRFDNRWMVFPQDFPSAPFLKSQGIHQVCLVQSRSTAPANDLSHVLADWQENGIVILSDNIMYEIIPQPIKVARPSMFRSIFYRMQALLGFKKNSAGGFGMWIPEPSQSTGYG